MVERDLARDGDAALVRSQVVAAGRKCEFNRETAESRAGGGVKAVFLRGGVGPATNKMLLSVPCGYATIASAGTATLMPSKYFARTQPGRRWNGGCGLTGSGEGILTRLESCSDAEEQAVSAK